jgi:hypothetical protein
MPEINRIRICLALFMIGLALSGLTAFPLVHETALLVAIAGHFAAGTMFFAWVNRVHEALVATSVQYPFLASGTDWLAFAHLTLTVVFIGPWRDPVRNKWVIQFGLIACAGVIPLALIAGPIRGIPLFWSLGDCCFGVFGAIPLLIALQAVRRMEDARLVGSSAAV